MDERALYKMVGQFLDMYNSRGLSGVYELRRNLRAEIYEKEEINARELIIKMLEKYSGVNSSERMYWADSVFRESVLDDLKKNIIIDRNENEEG